MEDGQEIIIMKGGMGGLGNMSISNLLPIKLRRYAQTRECPVKGLRGFELKILADVGLVGFPNAGNLHFYCFCSKTKITDYAFTTLTPNLGIVEYRNFKSFVMADIPNRNY